MSLDNPFEFLELADGGSISFHVLHWEQGPMSLVPRDGRPPKTVNGVRLYLPREEKPNFPYYYDTNSQRLVAQLLPLLNGIVSGKKLLTITQRGSPPAVYYALDVK